MGGRKLAAVLLALLLTVVAARADQIDEYLRAEMARQHVAGLAVAIVRDGRVVKLQGYGTANLEWDAPVTPDTAFQLASTTKVMTGVALMTLVEEGRISLDDPVSKYIADAPESWAGITVRHLATHSSGLADDLGPAKIETIAAALDAAKKLPLAYKPGERSAYGFTDFVVLTKIIEQVTGKPLPVFLKERIFDPLGMSATGFDNATEEGSIRASDLIKRRAAVYRWDGGSQKISYFLYTKLGYSAGGLYSSASDLAKFAQALDSGKLLKQSSLDLMWERRTLGEGKPNSFGIGWVVGLYGGRRTVGHSGGPALSDLLRFPEDKLTIVVLTNAQRLYPHLAQGVADFYYPPKPPAAAKGIADADRSLTAALKRLLLEGAEGKFDENLFAPPARANLLPAMREFGTPYLSSLGPLRSFVLIEEGKEGDALKRRYQAIFGTKAVVWTFTLDGEGKIVSMEPSQE
jgi:CubicO group peptidase (beta-lactamase class C family)